MNTSQEAQDQPTGHDAPPPLPQPDSAGFFRWLRSLGITRGSNRWVGGVCSGLADKWGIDPVIVRGLVVVLTLFFGIGLLAYGVAWALLPEPDGRIHVEEVGRGHWSTGMTGAAAATLLGLGGSSGGTFQGGGDWLFWPVLWIGGIAWAIYWFGYRGKQTSGGENSDKQASDEQTGGGQTSGGDSTGTLPGGPNQHTGQSWYGNKSPGTGWQGTSWQSPGQPEPATPYAQSFTPHANDYLKYQPATQTVRTPVKHPVKQTPRLGAAGSWLVLGIAAVVVATILLLNAGNVIDLGTHTGAIVTAVAAVVAGLGIVIAGISGRTAGGLGSFAVIALVVAGALSLPQANIASFSNADWAPTSISAAETGRTILAGNGTVDLTGLGLDTSGAAVSDGGTPLTDDVLIPIDVVASNVTILVPANIPVSVKSQLAAAAVTVDGKSTGSGLVKDSTSTINPDAVGHGLIITLDGAAANVEIQVVTVP